MSDKIIEAFEKWFTFEVMMELSYPRKRDLTDILEDACYEAFKAAQPQWIPVEERLPKDGQIVLCFVTSYEQDELGRVGVACFDCGFFYYSDCEDGMFEKVSHWQPLPEPPKE